MLLLRVDIIQTCMPTSQESHAEEFNVEEIIALCAKLFGICNFHGYPPMPTQAYLKEIVL